MHSVLTVLLLGATCTDSFVAMMERGSNMREMRLAKGGCYAMLNDGPVNRYFLKQRASKHMNLTSLDFVVSDDFYGFAVQKGNKALLERLNKSLDEIKADGTFDRIYEKWFGQSESTQSAGAAQK